MMSNFETNNVLENPEVTNINRLLPRAVLIPAQKEGVYYKNKEESEYLQSLNGEYDFLYCTQDSVPDFYVPSFDACDWNKIDVPSMWQFRGYGSVCYPNTNYPIPFNPPYIDCENPVGYYRKKFNATKSQKTILHFGGVDSAFFVYLNGTFVGFSKGSRNVAEFDVTQLIVDGENLLAVKVFTYCDATYLENQDMLLASGIFRDVYLLHTDALSVWDYRVTSDLKGFDITVELSEQAQDCTVLIAVGNEEKQFKAEKNISARFDIKNPKLWNAEQPNLYNLKITLCRNEDVLEIHSKKIGMMHSEIVGNQVLVNGNPIYIKGINRHEYDCKNGRAVSIDLIEKEVKMIKENNLNAIRCSHYTNNPAFYEFCSEIGVYVMDEADIESHGCEVTSVQGYLTRKAEWLPLFMDKTERMLQQNKNEVCIFMHSMSNEAGSGKNLIKALQRTLEFDPDHIAIHDMTENEKAREDFKSDEYDFIKRDGYLSRADVEKAIAENNIFMQVEYAHAMGNSPGFLDGYQKMVYENENYIGGFAWEFKNHGFHQVDENGEDYYLYGGDFGDINHWSNFCLDGYITSDGTPKPSWYELGQAVAPVWVTYDGTIKLKNTYDFKNLDVFCLKWEILEDFAVIKSGEMQLPPVPPHEEIVLEIDTNIATETPGARYFLNLYFEEDGVVRGTRQIAIKSNEKKAYQPPEKAFEVDKEKKIVRGENFEVKFEDGVLAGYIKDGKPILDKKMELNIYRAHTDNDGVENMPYSYFKREAGVWKDSLLYDAKYHVRNSRFEIKKDRVIFISEGKLMPRAKWLGFGIKMEFHIFSDGNIMVKIDGTPYGKLPDILPRIGVYFELDKAYNDVCWLGRGDKENYADSIAAAPIGLYQKNIEKTYFKYDVPQECGNHEDTIFATVSDKDGAGLSVIGLDSFAFSAHDFDLKTLCKARHKNELKKSDSNYLYIDYKMRGLGSRSCGPCPEEEFELRPHNFSFAFVFCTETDTKKALDVSRMDFGCKTSTGDEYTFSGINRENLLL